MSYPIFKDFDKCPSDIIDEDFSTKYTLKIKSAGPESTVFTTTTELKKGLVPKLALKWAHASGFTLEKLEVSPEAKITVETSLSKVAPGLKLEFKGNDSDKADLSFTYSHPKATVTGDVDVSKFSSAKASINGGYNAFTLGASVDVKIAKSTVDSTSLDVGLGYTVPKTAFVGLRASKTFANYSAIFSYAAYPNITLAGLLSIAKGISSPVVTVASLYKCNPNTVVKVKASSSGVLSASVKQNFDKKFAVIAAAEATSLKDVKFGINATLG